MKSKERPGFIAILNQEWLIGIRIYSQYCIIHNFVVLLIDLHYSCLLFI